MPGTRRNLPDTKFSFYYTFDGSFDVSFENELIKSWLLSFDSQPISRPILSDKSRTAKINGFSSTIADFIAHSPKSDHKRSQHQLSAPILSSSTSSSFPSHAMATL